MNALVTGVQNMNDPYIGPQEHFFGEIELQSPKLPSNRRRSEK